MVKYTVELRPHRTEFKYASIVFWSKNRYLHCLQFSADLSRQIFPKKKLASGYFNQV